MRKAAVQLVLVRIHLLLHCCIAVTSLLKYRISGRMRWQAATQSCVVLVARLSVASRKLLATVASSQKWLSSASTSKPPYSVPCSSFMTRLSLVRSFISQVEVSARRRIANRALARTGLSASLRRWHQLRPASEHEHQHSAGARPRCHVTSCSGETCRYLQYGILFASVYCVLYVSCFL